MGKQSLASLVVDLQVESAQLRAGLDKATAQVRGFGAQLAAASKRGAEGFTILKGVMANLATQALNNLGGALTNSIRLFAESEKAQRQLTAAAAQMGYDVQAVVPALAAQADAMERNFGISADLTNQMQQMMLRFGAAPKDIGRTTQALHDYAAASGKDANASTQLLLTAVEAGRDSLGKMGINIKATGDKAKDLNLVVDELAKKFGGAAAANAETLSGQMAILGQDVEDLQKAFAGFVASVARSTGILGALSEAIRGAKAFIDQGGDSGATPQALRTNEITALMEQRIGLVEKLADAEKREALFFAQETENEKREYGESFKRMMTYSRQLSELDAKLKKLRDSATMAGNAAAGITGVGGKGGRSKDPKSGGATGEATWFGRGRAAGPEFIPELMPGARAKDYGIDTLATALPAMTGALQKVWEDAHRLEALTEKSRGLGRPFAALVEQARKLGQVGGEAFTAAVDEVEALRERIERLKKGIKDDAELPSTSFPEVFDNLAKKFKDKMELAALKGGRDISAGFGLAAASFGQAGAQAAPRFSAMMTAAMQGSAAGPWGAVAGAVASLLTQTESFGAIMAQVEQGMSMLVQVLEPVLKPLLLVGTAGNALLGVLTQVVGPVLDAIGKGFFTVFRVAGLGLLDAIIGLKDFWNGIVGAIKSVFVSIGDVFKGIPVIGGALASAMYWAGDAVGKLAATTSGLSEARDKLAKETWETLGQSVPPLVLPPLEALGDASLGASRALKDFTESVTNTPRGWRVEGARAEAQDGRGGPVTGERAGGPMVNRSGEKILVVGLSMSELWARLSQTSAKQAFRSTGSPIGSPG